MPPGMFGDICFVTGRNKGAVVRAAGKVMRYVSQLVHCTGTELTWWEE